MNLEALIEGKKIVLLDFYANWCGPCMSMMPILDHLKTMMGDDFEIVKIDVDKNLDLAVSQKVMGVPTFALFVDGIERWRAAGTYSASELSSIIRQFQL